MKGQWIGTYKGSVEGLIVVNVDEMEDHYEAVTFLNPYEQTIPNSIAYLVTSNKNLEQQIVADVKPVNPNTGFECNWEEIKGLYPEGVSHSEKANVNLKLVDGKLHLNATSDIGVELSCTLTKPSEVDKSKIIATKMSWADFKSSVTTFSKSKYLYRGQKENWRLKTSFYRQGRYRISTFRTEDVIQLHKRLSPITSHYFELSIPEQYGSFINLIQHHGYPTPLLDWTYSPYVSAFFAFRDWPIGYTDKENCRIYLIIALGKKNINKFKP